ncbi:hypothetical protein MNEG_14202 [Monoraphidium neglectum]|jgi:hypothetical protein|uniref:Uncharacterized protein n=1 Tax=Monoraphidium neglectum TaxID=145388 RepID=A0A0D2LPU2_9CHLO|nr:hypothetical protein MNEG_14202 [Monoraphidium neglectum]KIY93759.1 hypothetical protein MNEG_14202 [Monoraphidium neglectum]|eukprot:XP_013892779.1 hypothetical protein MNEG_14202 [Monoraphidium neglectum]
MRGCSSACLIWASLSDSRRVPGPAARWLARNRAWAAWLWAPVGAAAVAANVLYPAARGGVNETIYLATTSLAIATLFLNEVLRAPRGSKEARHVRAAGCIAAATAALGVPADHALRAATGGWFSAQHATFLGCDLAFAAVRAYLFAKRARLAKAV